MSKFNDHFWSAAFGVVAIPATAASAVSADSPFAAAVIIAAAWTIVSVVHKAEEFKAASAIGGGILSIAAMFGASSYLGEEQDISNVPVLSDSIKDAAQVDVPSLLKVSVSPQG